MKVIIILVFLTDLLIPTWGYCEELTPAKKAAIKTLMQVSGEAPFVEIIGNNLIRKITQSIKRAQPDIDPKVFDLVKEEGRAAIKEEYDIKESYQPYFYPIYHRYFTFEEIKELIIFYQTPLGRKLVAVTPKLARESIKAEKLWAQQIFGPNLKQRISSRFYREGIELDI
jgi:hypothetical protein